jgi:hypothetical protein
MSDKKFHDRAIELVYAYTTAAVFGSGKLAIEDVTIVWFAKTLQNWKALVITHTPDSMYYEVTYNGDRGETYIDVYKKFDNVCVRDDERWCKYPRHLCDTEFQYIRSDKCRGFTIQGVWLDEIQNFQSTPRTETPGKADDSEWEDPHMG